MSIFNSILGKIFGGHTSQASSTPAAAPAAPPSSPAIGAVDVEEVLMEMERKSPQHLQWRSSIVDLMKLLGIDSSLEARKKLAQELHYSGNPDDSAGMNIWLHEQVMKKLEENGGKVPSDLKKTA